MKMTLEELRIKARDARLSVGAETKRRIIECIAESNVPLTINEINHLMSNKFGRSVSRQHLRIVLQDIVNEKKIFGRFETSAEKSLRGGAARGNDALLFGTAETIDTVRQQLPFKTRYKAIYKTKSKKAAKPELTVDALIESIVADRTRKLVSRVAELEAKLAKIAKITK